MILWFKVFVLVLATLNAAIDGLLSLVDWYLWNQSHHAYVLAIIVFIYSLAVGGFIGAGLLWWKAERILAA